MAAYFDTTDNADLAMLPKILRTAEELADVAAESEADVILQYTEPQAADSEDFTLRENLRFNVQTGDFEFVYLAGFTEDAADPDVDPGLKKAMKRTVAAVIHWRLNQWKREPGVISESDDRGKSRTYSDQIDSPFPPGWDRWLAPFDTREPAWGT